MNDGLTMIAITVFAACVQAAVLWKAKKDTTKTNQHKGEKNDKSLKNGKA